MHNQYYDDLAQMARERQAAMRREAEAERLLRDADLPERKARPMQRKLVVAFAAASLIVFVFAQTVNAAH
jgi:hypothetical protein